MLVLYDVAQHIVYGRTCIPVTSYDIIDQQYSKVVALDSITDYIWLFECRLDITCGFLETPKGEFMLGV